MNYFEEQGRALLANGYLIIPIKPGHKRPALGHWQEARLGIHDLGNYPGHGVGILTGQGAYPICAVDIDCTDQALSDRFAQWCKDNLGYTCERVGRAPKTLLVYRANAEGIQKATGKNYTDKDGNKHRLEILGHGQQFVAYHIHPDTKQPYEWVDLACGGLEDTKASELPVLSKQQIDQALDVFDAMAIEAGLTPVKGSERSVAVPRGAYPVYENDDPFNDEPPINLKLSDAAEALSVIENASYDVWLKAGMAMHHEFKGSDAAFGVWDRWSSTAENYKGIDDTTAKWASFGSKTREPVTARWLLKVSRENKKEIARSVRKVSMVDIREKIAACDDQFDLMNALAKEAGEVAGEDPAANAEFIGLFKNKFKELTGMPISLPEIRKAMGNTRKVTAFNAKRHPLTEFGNSDRMLDRHGKSLMYVPHVDSWFIWTGVYWRRSAAVELEFFARLTIEALAEELLAIDPNNSGEQAAFGRFFAESQRVSMVSAMVRLARASPQVCVSVTDLDKYSHLLGVANGVVNLLTGTLHESNPENRITMSTAVAYNPEAKCPLFEQTVSDVFFGKEDEISFFKRLIGYSIMGNPNLTLMAIPFGSGSNGKSTILGAIRDVLGDYAKSASADTFLTAGGTKGNGGGPREDLVRLRGARFVYVNEPDEGSELKEGLIKAITGGDEITARGLFSTQSIQIKPTWVTFMPTNHRPVVKGSDNGIWRRLWLIPFIRNFDADASIKKDSSRSSRLASEAEGILKWCIDAASQFQKEGLERTGSVLKASEEYREDMDIIGEWISQCLVEEKGARATLSACWNSWNDFARANGDSVYIKTQRALSQRLLPRYPRAKSKGVRYLEGVKIIGSDDFSE